ncbi:MAG: hypothetical protein R2707_06725 [Acidimicrobiales bacterium]
MTTAPAADQPSDADADPASDSGDGPGEWGADLTGAEVCAAGDAAAIEAIVGTALAEAGPLDTGGVATCVLDFDGENAISTNSVNVVAWPASTWDGRSPADAYDYRYDINVGPGGIEVEEVEVGARAHLMVGANGAWVTVLTGDRVFEVKSSTVDPSRLRELAGVFATRL